VTLASFLPLLAYAAAELVRPALLHLIEKEHPQWQPNGFI